MPLNDEKSIRCRDIINYVQTHGEVTEGAPRNRPQRETARLETNSPDIRKRDPSLDTDIHSHTHKHTHTHKRTYTNTWTRERENKLKKCVEKR